MLSKSATTAASYAKDIGSQATAKATELGGSVTEKVGCSLPCCYEFMEKFHYV